MRKQNEYNEIYVFGAQKYTKTKRTQRIVGAWDPNVYKNKTETATFRFLGPKSIQKQNENSEV